MTASEAISGMNSTGTASGAGRNTALNFGSKVSGMVDFGSIMNQSLATKANSKDMQLYTNVADSAQTKNPNNNGSGGSNADRVVSENPAKQSKQELAADGVDDVNQAQTDTVDLDRIKSMSDEIKQKIKDTLGISDEELEAVLAQLGFSIQDLLNTANLTKLVVQVKGADGALSLITDSELSTQLKDIMNFISEQTARLADEMNMTPQEVTDYVTDMPKEETFSQILDNAKALTEEPDAEEADKVLPKEEAVQQMQPDYDSDTPVQTSALDKKIVVMPQQENGNAQSSDSQQQKGAAPEEHSSPVTDIAANLTQSINEVFEETAVQDMPHVDAADIIQQIIDSVKVTAAESLQSMELQLNPEHLGKIHLTVTAKDGIMTAQFTAQDEAVKKAIESQLAQLKENLNNQGLKVQNVEVTVESHAYEQNRDLAGNDRHGREDGRSQKKHLNLDSLMGLDEEEFTEEEKRAMELLKNEGSSVSYTA